MHSIVYTPKLLYSTNNNVLQRDAFPREQRQQFLYANGIGSRRKTGKKSQLTDDLTGTVMLSQRSHVKTLVTLRQPLLVAVAEQGMVNETGLTET